MTQDTQEQNRLIALYYNEGYSNREISTKLYDHGLSLGKSAISERIRRMKDQGTLDYIKSDPDFLTELEEESGQFLKIGILDIETTGLWADFGYVLCAVIKNVDKDEYEVLRLDECKTYQDPELRPKVELWRRVDRELLLQIREAYEKYDIIIHYNGRWFDIKFLNTRMIKNGVPILPEMKQLDIYQIAKHRMRLRSKRLDALKEFLEIDQDKDGHRWEYWQMAAAGVKEGFDFVVDHCKRDVKRLGEVSKRMKTYINYIRK